MISHKIANGDAPKDLIECSKGFKRHFVARIGMLQAELDTYIRLVDKQKGLNQMMSSRILQQTIMERDNSIKKELNWLGSWFGIGSSASLQQKLKFHGTEEDADGTINVSDRSICLDCRRFIIRQFITQKRVFDAL